MHHSIEHAALAVGFVLLVGEADEVAKHEVVVGAHARGRSDDVAGRVGEIKAGKAIGVVPHFGMPAHAELAAGGELRVGKQAGHGHDWIGCNSSGLKDAGDRAGTVLRRPIRKQSIERFLIGAPRRRRGEARISRKLRIPNRLRQRGEIPVRPARQD